MIATTVSRAFRRLTGEAWVFDPFGAGVRVPAIATALAAGMATGRPVPGVLAASGAFLVGFGARLDLFGSRLLLLTAATLVIGASAIAGSIAAVHGVTAVLVVAVAGALCGLAAARDPGTAWIALQCALATVIATSYPASPGRAVLRAELIVAGGAAQVVVLSFAHLVRRHVPPPPVQDRVEPRYALHLAIGLAVAMTVERGLAMPNGYWAPMTTLLVLRPATRSTMTRAFARTLGTLAGVGLASSLLLLSHVPAPVLVALVAAGAFGAYTFQKATYGFYAAFVSMYVIFLLAFAGLPERDVAVARVEATLLGAAIGLGVQLVDDALAAVTVRPKT